MGGGVRRAASPRCRSVRKNGPPGARLKTRRRGLGRVPPRLRAKGVPECGVADMRWQKGIRQDDVIEVKKTEV